MTANAVTALADLLSVDSVLRSCASLIAADLSERSRVSIPGSEVAGWCADTELPIVDADSEAACVARIKEFFGVHQVQTGKLLSAWAESVYRNLPSDGGAITFRSSGSTGEPKRSSHTAADLSVESESVTPLFPDTKRILSLVPPHHLYGWSFTVILPERLGVPVVDIRAWTPSRMVSELTSGDLLVAVPAQWQSLERLPGLRPGVVGLSATAPLPRELVERLLERGLERMNEIYGSSENGAMAWRDDWLRPFHLLAHFRRTQGGLLRCDPAGSERLVEVQDRLVWYGPTELVPAGRIDEAVQVGAMNVYPRRVADVIREHPDVVDCAVRLSQHGGAAARLEAFVVPRPGAGELAAALREWCASRLPPEARPRVYKSGPALLTNEMGKLTGW